jgi:SpoVK/Ycf46/Vps4 family AAA+-type ATPase
LAKDSDGFSGAEIALVCREAGLRALTEQIEAKNAQEIYVESKHFLEALEGVKNRGNKK